MTNTQRHFPLTSGMFNRNHNLCSTMEATWKTNGSWECDLEKGPHPFLSIICHHLLSQPPVTFVRVLGNSWLKPRVTNHIIYLQTILLRMKWGLIPMNQRQRHKRRQTSVGHHLISNLNREEAQCLELSFGKLSMNLSGCLRAHLYSMPIAEWVAAVSTKYFRESVNVTLFGNRTLANIM
jgi:hypothetical protein